MYLKELSLFQFKNHSESSFQFNEKINCFVGNNGVGKTNILDAIHYLSLTKSYFNHIFESSNLAMRKPEKKIYNYVLKNLGVKAEEILFIDDLGINLKPARLLGFHTYKFIDTKTTIDFVKNLLKI